MSGEGKEVVTTISYGARDLIHQCRVYGMYGMVAGKLGEYLQSMVEPTKLLRRFFG